MIGVVGRIDWRRRVSEMGYRGIIGQVREDKASMRNGGKIFEGYVIEGFISWSESCCSRMVVGYPGIPRDG